MTSNLNSGKFSNYISNKKVKNTKRELVVGLIMVTTVALIISMFKPERNYNLDPEIS